MKPGAKRASYKEKSSTERKKICKCYRTLHEKFLTQMCKAQTQVRYVWPTRDKKFQEKLKHKQRFINTTAIFIAVLHADFIS